MANLVNANSNENYFQFHGSHYKFKKGVPLGLPISRSIFQNFLQNFEGKFTKSSNQRRALTHYPARCLRRQLHLTYLFHPTQILWIWQIPVGTPQGPHRALCIITSFVTPSMEFMVFKRCRYQ